jgi:hypothetical protein
MEVNVDEAGTRVVVTGVNSESERDPGIDELGEKQVDETLDLSELELMNRSSLLTRPLTGGGGIRIFFPK